LEFLWYLVLVVWNLKEVLFLNFSISVLTLCAMLYASV